MRCLYCGKHLPLFRKLTSGGEFCSDAHRDKYHEEYNKLAVSRLLQAQSRPEEAKRGKKKAEAPPKPPVEAEVEVSPAVEVKPEVLDLPKAPDLEEAATLPEAANLPKATKQSRKPEQPKEPPKPQEPEIEVVAYVNEFQRFEVSAVSGTLEWMPVDLEQVVPPNTPALPSLPESARPRLEAGGLQSQQEADFLTTRPLPQRGNASVIDTASPLSAEAGHAIPLRSASGIGTTGPPQAAAITRDSLPVGYPREFEPLALGVAAAEFTNPATVVGTSNSTPVTHDLSKAGLVELTLPSQPPDEGTLEIETMATFRYLIELRPAFEPGLSLLDPGADEGSDAASIETVKTGTVITPAAAVNGNVAQNAGPLEVTPRRVLVVWSRMQGDSHEPANGEPQPVAASSPSAEPPAARSALKPLTIPTLAPGPAALLAGFPPVPLGTNPVMLFSCPLPLRPKMAVGTAPGAATT